MNKRTERPTSEQLDLKVLERIERRVLWLAVRIVDHANRERPKTDGLKVGGHQASSASLATVMTALWFAHLRATDRVAVKPHAAPVLHAIEYLLGRLDRSMLTQLRSFGGLQAYPSRTKDPFPVDFSTGSVGHGAVGPLFAAAVRRYIDTHFGERPASRFIALIGDAELDEGNIWEAVAEPSVRGLGNVLWIVDFNRQSLDRVVPGIRIEQWRAMFKAHGWHTEEVKYGARLQAAFSLQGGVALRRRLDEMSNEEYQGLFVCPDDEIAARLIAQSDELDELLGGMSPAEIKGLIRNLGGHDLASLIDAFGRCTRTDDRPSVVFAYTLKGYGLPIEGDPHNHSALLTGEQIDELRLNLGVEADHDWDRFPNNSDEAELCRLAAGRLERAHAEPVVTPDVPTQAGVSTSRPVSTQATFGRLMTSVSRMDDLARYVVTAAPDVATSTNLAGWINKVGVFAPERRPTWMDGERPLRWIERPTGQHLELGISEMNLMAMLGQLGLAKDLHGAGLLPIGTVYDPFVCRGLDALIYAAYCGARFLVIGTPSGITLSPEGGAHQSTITPSIGIELPSLMYVEPAYATALDWVFFDSLNRMVRPDGGATYLRLSTRPIDQGPFERLRARRGDEKLRTDVLAGGYVLRDAEVSAGEPLVHLVACGTVVTEALAAANELAHEGVAARVIDITSPDKLYGSWSSNVRSGVRKGFYPTETHHLRRLFPVTMRNAPVVTMHDAASHALAWIGSALGVPAVPLGVDRFGQSGTVSELYGEYNIDAAAVTNAALVALELSSR